MAPLDLVCRDVGDTLVDERFMRIPPAGILEWTAVYDRALDNDPAGWRSGCSVGRR